MVISLLAYDATFLSCVIRMTVFPMLFNSENTRIISFPVLLSNAPVGSSASIVSAPHTIALAIATRCF